MQTPSPPIRRSARTSGRSAVEEIALEAAAVPPAPVKKVVAQRRVAPTPALKPVVVDSGAARNNPAKTVGDRAGARDSVSPRELISTATGFESALSDGTRVCEGEGEASTPRFARQAAKRAAQNNLRRKLERQFEKHRRESLEGPDAARAIKRVRLKSPAECDDAALDHGACPFEPLPMLTREELDADAFFAPGPGASPAALFGDEFRSLGAELLDWKTAGAPTEATAAMDADDAVSSAAGGDAAGAPAFARALERDAACAAAEEEEEAAFGSRQTLRNLLVRHGSSGVVSDAVAVPSSRDRSREATPPLDAVAERDAAADFTAGSPRASARRAEECARLAAAAKALAETAARDRAFSSPAKLFRGKSASSLREIVGAPAGTSSRSSEEERKPLAALVEARRGAAGQRRRKPTLGERLRGRETARRASPETPAKHCAGGDDDATERRMTRAARSPRARARALAF